MPKLLKKIKNSNDNKEKVKTQTNNPDLNKAVKPEGLSKCMEIELKRIETERSKQSENAQTVLAATKQIKRANICSLLGYVGAKKTQAHAEINLIKDLFN